MAVSANALLPAGDVLELIATGAPLAETLDALCRAIDRRTPLASIAVERHQTEEGRRESERRFSPAFYSSPGCLSITRSADGRFMYVNDRFVTLFGYSRAEAVGQTAFALGLYRDAEQRTRLWALLDEHKAHDVEVT